MTNIYSHLKSYALFSAAFLAAASTPGLAQEFSFVETKNQQLAAPFVTAGNQIYCVGYQDGTFPPMGDHVKGEMGGVWAQPIKLLDGFGILRVKDLDSGEIYENLRATQFSTFPHQCVLHYTLPQSNIQLKCTIFAPMRGKSMRVEYALLNPGSRPKNLQIVFQGRVDLRPGFFSDKVGWTNAPDTIRVDAASQQIRAKDLENNWFVIVSADERDAQLEVSSVAEPEPLNPNQTEIMDVAHEKLTSGQFHNKEFTITETCTVPAGKTAALSYYISGSYRSEEEAVAECANLRRNFKQLLAEKEAHFQNLVHRSEIQIPDKKLQRVYNWVRFNTEWLIQDVPEIGRGFCAGYPHYIWWFGTDNSYALQGILATGDFETAKSTLRLLKEQSQRCNGNGRVIHEVVPSGAIVNLGNTQETAHFIMAVWNCFRWTGDREFLREFYPFVKQGITWLTETQDQNRNQFPEGYGIMEVKGLNAELIDVAVYTEQALEAVAQMAAEMGESQLQQQYSEQAKQLKNKINTLFWDERSSLYCDFFGTAAQAVSVVDGSLQQYQEHADVVRFYNDTKAYFQSFDADYQHGWSTNRNWVINTPMETGIAPREQALAALRRMEQNDMTSQWGPYLSAVDKLHNMTISTGVQAVAQAQYRQIDRALMHVNQIANTFGMVMPGSIAEMMPDYGCFCQEWTIYSVAVPLIQYIFGVQPDAQKHSVTLSPQIPTGWDNYTLKNQRIGDNQLNLSIARDGDTEKYTAQWQNDASWKMTLRLPYHPTAIYRVNGKQAQNLVPVDGMVEFSATGSLEVTASPAL